MDDKGVVTYVLSKLGEPSVTALFAKYLLYSLIQIVYLNLLSHFLIRSFYPILFAALPRAQELFEHALGAANEAALVTTMSHIITVLSAINSDSRSVENDAFVLRARKYAAMGITEAMLSSFNVSFVKACKAIFGDSFTMDFVHVMGDFMETVSQALFDAGEEEVFFGALKMLLERNDKSSNKVPYFFFSFIILVFSCTTFYATCT